MADSPHAPDETWQPAYAAPLFTPVNLILLAFLVITVYIQLRPRAALTRPKHPDPIVFRTFTPRTLLPYNGGGSTTSQEDQDGQKDKPSIYMAVRGTVYDVTPGKQFYGPRGPYANFAGRDASRGLALGSFDEEVLTKDLDGPLDTLVDLGAEEQEALRGWEEMFREKYLAVGRLVAEGSKELQVESKSD